jgi:hypothetical protein
MIQEIELFCPELYGKKSERVCDWNQYKIGMIVSFESDGGLIDGRIQAYQERIGFTGESSRQSHTGVSLGGPYMASMNFPISSIRDLRTDYRGRKYTLLYGKSESFRSRCRYKFALWAASKMNLPYNFFALLGYELRILIPLWAGNPLGVNYLPVCSAMVAWAYRKTGFEFCPGVPSDLITPAHFFASSVFEHVGGVY